MFGICPNCVTLAYVFALALWPECSSLPGIISEFSPPVYFFFKLPTTASIFDNIH